MLAPDFVPAGKSGRPEEIKRSWRLDEEEQMQPLDIRLTLEKLKTGELEQHLEV